MEHFTHLQIIEAQEAELRQEIYEYLRQCGNAGVEDEYGLDLRLQITVNDEYECASWQIHLGDPSYDQDHRGYWGCSSLAGDEDDKQLMEVAQDLVEQAIEHCSACI